MNEHGDQWRVENWNRSLALYFSAEVLLNCGLVWHTLVHWTKLNIPSSSLVSGSSVLQSLWQSPTPPYVSKQSPPPTLLAPADNLLIELRMAVTNPRAKHNSLFQISLNSSLYHPNNTTVFLPPRMSPSFSSSCTMFAWVQILVFHSHTLSEWSLRKISTPDFYPDSIYLSSFNL